MAKKAEKTPAPAARRAFAKRLRAFRTTKYDTQEEFADDLGVPGGTYSRWERAETEPDITTLTRIIAILGISANDLISPQRVKRRQSPSDKPSNLRRFAS